MFVQNRMDFGSGMVDVPLPANWVENIKLSMVFTEQMPSSTMSGAGFTWMNTKDDQTAGKIISRINDGITGGLGIGEGIGYEIFIPGPTPIYLFQGILNLPTAEVDCDKVTLNVKYVNAIDWFHTLMQSITFFSLTANGLASAGINPPTGYTAYIGEPGSGSKYEYKIVPYVVTQETDIPMALTTMLGLYGQYGQIKTAVSNTKNSITKVAAVFTTDPPADIAAALIAILGLVVQLAWDTILLTSIVGNLESLINQCGILLKYKYAMTAADLLNASFDYVNNYLGTPSGNPINFKSSILLSGVYENTTIMPAKFFKENYKDITPNIVSVFMSGGIATRGTEVNGGNLPPYNPGSARAGCYGYPEWDAKRLLDELYKVFNAKCFMLGQNVFFEEQHYFVPSSYSMPNSNSPGFSLNWFGPKYYNWNELNWNYEKRFQTDSSDVRTEIVYTGTQCNVCTQPAFTKNVQYVLPCEGKSVMMGFALAKRKEYLNFIENVVNDMLGVIGPIFNDIATVLNDISGVYHKVFKVLGISLPTINIPLMPTSITGLIGAMELSNDTFSIPKIFIGEQRGALWYIDPNNGANDNGVWNNPNVPSSTPMRGEGHMSAWALMNLFDSKNLPLFTPVDSAGNKQPQVNNQWILYKTKRMAMCGSDYQTILGSNMFFAPNKQQAKFDRLTFVPADNEGEDVTFRVAGLYTDNFIVTVTIDGN